MANITEKHIFILDDEPTVRKVIKETLKDLNYKVSCFGDPVECLVHLRTKKCDLLITDLKMPKKDGVEVLVNVRHQAPLIPVLMMTGYGDIPTVVRAMKAGAVDFIEKPLDKKNFVQKIKSILKEHTSTHSELVIPLIQTEKKVL